MSITARIGGIGWERGAIAPHFLIREAPEGPASPEAHSTSVCIIHAQFSLFKSKPDIIIHISLDGGEDWG